MAITRAQQAKQMLQDGGMLVKPSKDGKRPGYKFRKGPGETKRERQATSQYSGPPQDVRRGGGKDSISISDSFKDDSSPQDNKVDVGFQEALRKQRRKDLKDLANRQADDKREELVERFRNRPINFPGGPGLTPVLAKIFGKGLQRNAFNLRSNLIRLGDKFSVPDMRRGIITGKMFDANIGKRKSNLIANLLDGRTLYDLTDSQQEDLFDEVMDARLKGLTDASGNLAPGVFIGADGQLIDTRDDRGGGQEELPIIPKQEEPEEVEEEYVNPLSLLTPRIAGSRFLGSEFAADGGRIGYRRGGRRGDTGQASYSVSDSFTPSRDDDSPQQTITKTKKPTRTFGDDSDAIKFTPRQLASFGIFGDPKKRQQLAEVFDRKKLLESGAAVPGIVYGYNLTDKGEALEEFLETAKNFYDAPKNPAKTPQAALDLITSDKFRGTYGKSDMVKEKDFIQKAIDEGFLGKESDYQDQQPLEEYLAKGGMVNQNLPVLAAEGGIMDLGRQELFLGGIAKRLKKAARGVSRTLKKVAKSPIGKAAILGAIGFGIPGTSFGGLFGRAGTMFGFDKAAQGAFGTFGPKSALQKLGIMKSVGDAGMAPARIGPFAKLFDSPLGLITLASLGSGLYTKKQEDDDLDLNALYASGQLNPSLGIRGTGSELDFDFYGARTQRVADGGRIGYQEGSKEPVAKKTMPLLDMDGQEMDLRDNGGFVPIGRMEKADDVPARLSKNEFVFTADAVRNAGDGDVDKGAEVMYNMMKNLERGGNVSDESQGLEGAREMFQTSKRLEEVL